MSEDNQQLEYLRHSCAHLLGAAVLAIYPDVKLTIGPATDDGFYYDVEFSTAISDSDLPAIEAKMHELVQKWQKFEGREVTEQQGRDFYKDNKFKQELIGEIAGKKQPISIYKSGDFEDLCRGGHVEKPSEQLQHFKLLSLAGAYWRGSEKNPMLTRIYGTSFFSQAELDEYLQQREEAKLRDHRVLGHDLELFFIDDLVGKGLVMWLPKGYILREQVENLVKEMELKNGYQRVATPHIAKKELFETSGHLPYYADSIYPPMEMDDGVYYLKAMNCPHHHRIFGHSPKSYRDLPLRLAEYGTCYRNELSGTLAGLLRVRGMAMNDAHIYCRKDQIKEEFKSVINLTTEYFKIFGLENYWFRLSKWDPQHTDKYINEPENWQYSEQVLREVLEEMKVQFVEANDEAAFYGPKVDVQFKSVVGREETMSTIQLDFVARSRFGLNFIDESGQPNSEVFVIHRAPLSTHERFMAFLIEHFAGRFPTWMAPVQVKVLPVSEKFNEYAGQVVTVLKEAGLRAEIDDRDERLGAKIRQSEVEKVPYMLVVGGKEEEAKQVSVRHRDQGDLGTQTLSEFQKQILSEVSERRN
jgi:threonyl-tRNA synthetase